MGQGTALQPGYARMIETFYCDSVALRCVAIEKDMRA